MRIIPIGADWGYDSERCDVCLHLERSKIDDDGKFMVACDASQGICIKTKEVIYTFER